MRRDRLSAVLLEVVAEGGLEAASIRAIAARAGVAIGTVQHYFPTKDAMLRHAYRRVGEDSARARRSAPARPRRRRRRSARCCWSCSRSTPAVRRRCGSAWRSRPARCTAPALAAELRDDLAELHEAMTDARSRPGRRSLSSPISAAWANAASAASSEPRLSIGREIVERHGGQLRLTASGSAGNVFTFTLPA